MKISEDRAIAVALAVGALASRALIWLAIAGGSAMSTSAWCPSLREGCPALKLGKVPSNRAGAANATATTDAGSYRRAQRMYA
jgi:hypothetical protein